MEKIYMNINNISEKEWKDNFPDMITDDDLEVIYLEEIKQTKGEADDF
jgi:hypothetical protein